MLVDEIRKMSPLPPPRRFGLNPGTSSKKQLVVWKEEVEQSDTESESDLDSEYDG